MAVVSVRSLSQTDTAATLLVYQAVAVGVLSGVPLTWVWDPLTLEQVLGLVTIGVLATAGQWVGVKALQLGEAGLVGQAEYSKLIYAAVLGYLLFGEALDGAVLLGGALIVGSSAFVLQSARTGVRRRFGPV